MKKQIKPFGVTWNPVSQTNTIGDQMKQSLAGIAAANNSINGGPSVEMSWINTPRSESDEKAIGSLSASNIQKRGFTYPGDSNQGFGLFGAGFGLHGFVGHPHFGQPFFGRGLPFHYGGNFLNGFPGASYNKTFHPVLGDITGGGVAISNVSKIAHWKMALAVEAYRGFGVIKNVIDLMCNFASEGISIEHPSDAIRKFYERWAERVDLAGRIKDILRYYYKYGNVFIYTTFGKIDDAAYNRMRTARGDTTDPHFKDKLEEISEQLGLEPGERLIPWRYTLLNPFQMDLRGTKFFGEQKWVFVLDESTLAEAKKKTRTAPSTKQNSGKKIRKSEHIDFLDESDVNLPPEFRDLRKGRVIDLDQGKLWTLHYMKDDHEDWADPMVWPVINDITYKNKLRAMDMSVCDSVINAITVFKLGKLSEGFVAPKEHYDQLAEMLRTPSAAMTMVWNDALEIESNFPPVHQILGIQKYEAVDRDILAGLGVSEVIINGRGGNYANSFLSVRTLLERLEEGRREALKWVDRQLKTIAAIMGHRIAPSVKFGQMALRDEQKEKQLIIQLLDRNVISVEAALSVFDLNMEVERERLRKEKQINDSEDIFIRHGPFKDPFSDMLESEKMDREEEMVDKQAERVMREKRAMRRMQRERTRKQNIRDNGRPPQSEDIPQDKQRNTKPQGMAYIKELMDKRAIALNMYNSIEDLLVKNLLKKRGIKYQKSLSKEDRENLEKLSLRVFSSLSIMPSIDYSIIGHAINKLRPNSSILSLASELKSDFSKKNNREPSKDERREIYSMARAIFELGG